MFWARIVVSFFMLGWLTASAGPASDPTGAPVLVELFTSEGCSTCPPADAWLQRLEASQPIPGIQFIVLSEHVDYWDRFDWKDPYSSAALTSRQNAYVHALGLDSAYTPLFVVNGAAKLQTGDPQKMEQTFAEAAAVSAVPVRIVSAAIVPGAVRARLDIDAQASKSNADIFAVIALNRAETQVQRGENKGRRLTHVAVVRQMTKVAQVEAGKSLTRDIQLPFKPGTDPANLRLIVFVQEPGPGKVIGAAMRDHLEEAVK